MANVFIYLASSPKLSTVYFFENIVVDQDLRPSPTFLQRFLPMIIVMVAIVISSQNASIRFLTWIFEYFIRNDANLVPANVQFMRKNCVFTLPKISHLMMSRHAMVTDRKLEVNFLQVGDVVFTNRRTRYYDSEVEQTYKDSILNLDEDDSSDSNDGESLLWDNKLDSDEEDQINKQILE